MRMASVTVFNKSSVYKVIYNYLQNLALNSLNTAKSYESDIRQFFKIMRGKDIEQLDVEDIKFKQSDIEEYRLLLSKSYKNKTVNRKIASLSSLYKKFAANDLPVNPHIFDIEKLSEHDSNGYGVLSWEEVEKMIEIVRHTRNGEAKALLIEMAVVTGFRLNALLNLTWDNFEQKEGVWVVSALDKGNKIDEKAIQNDLWKRLQVLRGKDKVFNLHVNTVKKMMKYLNEKMGFDEKRNITFHSLKKCSLREAYLASNGDILSVARQGNHKSPTTSLKHYLEYDKDYSNMVSMQIGRKVDLSVLEQLSKEDLIRLISQCGRRTQMEIINKANKEMISND